MSASITAAVVGIGGTLVAQNQAKKTAQGLAGQQAAAGEKAQIDIDALNTKTQQAAKNNAIMAQDLEKQLTPEVSAFRTNSMQSLLESSKTGMDPYVAKGQKILGENLGIPINTPLLNAAIAKAQSDLALGGRLSADQQGEATRKGLSTAGTVAQGGGLGLGRDLVARDLGLTSAQMEQQRLMNASQIGAQESSKAQFDANNLLNSITQLRAIHDNDFAQKLQAAQFGQSISPPTVGLDPSTIANLTIANSNARLGAATNANNIAGAQNNANLTSSGQMLGAVTQGIQALPGAFKYFSTPTTITGSGGAPSAPAWSGQDMNNLVMS